MVASSLVSFRPITIALVFFAISRSSSILGRTLLCLGELDVAHVYGMFSIDHSLNSFMKFVSGVCVALFNNF